MVFDFRDALLWYVEVNFFFVKFRQFDYRLASGDNLSLFNFQSCYDTITIG